MAESQYSSVNMKIQDNTSITRKYYLHNRVSGEQIWNTVQASHESVPTVVVIHSRKCCQHFSRMWFSVELLISVEFSLSGSRFLPSPPPAFVIMVSLNVMSFCWKQKSGDALQMLAVTYFRHCGGPLSTSLFSLKTAACRIPENGSYAWINV